MGVGLYLEVYGMHNTLQLKLRQLDSVAQLVL